MSVLETLRQAESEIFDDKHPLIETPQSFRESYAIGNTMLACVDGYPNEIIKKAIKKTNDRPRITCSCERTSLFLEVLRVLES